MRTSAKGGAAAAAAACQSSERKLVRTLYKALVCSARSFEREPALNAFLYRRRIAAPASSSSSDDETAGGDAAVAGDSGAAADAAPPPTLMDEIYDEFLGSRQARFFHPDLSRRSVLEVVRHRFQQPLPLQPEAHLLPSFSLSLPCEHWWSEKGNADGGCAQEREMRLDLGFQVMKELEEAIAMGKQIGIVKGANRPR
jgi:hypothetical protein